MAKRDVSDLLVETRSNKSVLVWDKKVPFTRIEELKTIISEKYSVSLRSYWDLHKWSVTNVKQFWEEIWKYFQVRSSSPYTEVWVKTGKRFLDNEWFKDARFNYAENILRIRDDREALVCMSEVGEYEVVTYAQMFEEVKRYAAAFREHGLKKNDIVACYMSNRKEAIFATFAVASIGAIWSGSQPYYGARAAANIMQRLEPKMLIAVDRHQDSFREYDLLPNLPHIVNSTPSIQKVIIVPTKKESISKDISNIRNSYFLEDFLSAGLLPYGSVPDLVFEQLPFSHPLFITFTSGTTGLPKAPVHSAGMFLSVFVESALHWNLKSGDTIFNMFPCGWSISTILITTLGLGVRMILYSGFACNPEKNLNLWNICAREKISLVYLLPSTLDIMEKEGLSLDPQLKCDDLKLITVIGSPVKVQNIQYVLRNVKEEVFVGSLYGTTEIFEDLSGYDLNLPSYAGEIQVPALGMDVQCFNEEGKPVVGQIGEVVVVTPSPSFPLYLYKDENGSVMKENYFSRYPEVWFQNDQCWINPQTKGMVVIGRSDQTMVQYGERFGAADVYFAIHDAPQVSDYICVAQKKSEGEERAVLFVKMKPGCLFTPAFRKELEERIEDELWAECVPQLILEAGDIPYNINNKRMESVVKKILATNSIPNVANIKNPDSLKYFIDIPEVLEYYCN